MLYGRLLVGLFTRLLPYWLAEIASAFGLISFHMQATHIRISKQCIPFQFIPHARTQLLAPTAFLLLADLVSQYLWEVNSKQIFDYIFRLIFYNGTIDTNFVLGILISGAVKILLVGPAYATLIATEATLLPGPDPEFVALDHLHGARTRLLNLGEADYGSLLGKCIQKTTGRMVVLYACSNILTPVIWFVTLIMLLYGKGWYEANS